MEFTAKQIAQYVKGNVEGDENVSINTFAKIEDGVPGAISFLSSPKYTHYIYDTKSTIVLVDASIDISGPVNCTIIRVNNARDCVAKLLQVYSQAINPKKVGIAKQAYISETAVIGNDVYVGPGASIGDGAKIGDGCQIYPNTVIGDNVILGKDCIIYPNVTIYHSCKLGNNVTLHAGCVIGADGFGFAPNPAENRYDKIPQIGIVTIEDDVEIGANTCVDRSTMGSTYIRKGVKLDNLIQVAHNVDIGSNTVMSAQVGIAGTVKIGQWCMIGGQTGIAGHIEIGNQVFLGAKTGVMGNLKDNQKLMGNPATEKMPYFKSQLLLKRLPELYQQIRDLQKEVEALKSGK
nr:UDP-3-O-(3-hydroxymyristoyl)glucosamine N-acyltransferase [Prevotella sp.]